MTYTGVSECTWISALAFWVIMLCTVERNRISMPLACKKDKLHYLIICIKNRDFSCTSFVEAGLPRQGSFVKSSPGYENLQVETYIAMDILGALMPGGSPIVINCLPTAVCQLPSKRRPPWSGRMPLGRPLARTRFHMHDHHGW